MKSRINFTEEFELLLRLDSGAQRSTMLTDVNWHVYYSAARSPRHILFVFTFYWTSLLWSIDSCPKRASADQCHMTVSRAQEYNSLR